MLYLRNIFILIDKSSKYLAYGGGLARLASAMRERREVACSKLILCLSLTMCQANQ